MVYVDTLFMAALRNASQLEFCAMSQQTNRLVSMKVVMQMTSLSRSEIARREKAGKFPMRVRLSSHPRGRVAFLERSVQDWISQQVSECSS